MGEPDLDGLLARFTAWGAAPTVEGYVDLFAEGGTVFDSGMAAPLSGPQIEAAITSTLRLLDGFRLEPLRTGRSEDTLYVEARNTARLAGRAIEWDAVYCMTAAGEQVEDRALVPVAAALPSRCPTRAPGRSRSSRSAWATGPAAPGSGSGAARWRRRVRRCPSTSWSVGRTVPRAGSPTASPCVPRPWPRCSNCRPASPAPAEPIRAEPTSRTVSRRCSS